MNKNSFEFKLYSYEDVIKYFKKKNLKNLILFSQARSGSTFVTENLPKLMNFTENQVYHEGNFFNQHFSYLKHFVKKHNNFFLNINEFVYKRIELIKENTLYIYLFREHDEIKKSYEKAINKNYYMGWNEFYSRYKILFPEIDQNLHVSLFNHLIWQKQISKFEHALTLDFNSFENMNTFIKDRSKFTGVRQQKPHVVHNYSDLQNNLNFNFFEKFYFFCRRKLESRKKKYKKLLVYECFKTKKNNFTNFKKTWIKYSTC